jgi:hypothetical protein
MSTAIVIARPAGFGAGAFGALLAVYFGVLTLVSGWSFTVNQFSEFWFYIVPLAAGFGLQVELFWVGLSFNAAGIAYVGTKLWQATKAHAHCIA